MAEVKGGNAFPSLPTTAGTKRKRESKSMPKFYAVRVGKQPGIYHSWAECLDQVKGFHKAVFKSFTSLSEAEAFWKNESDGKDQKITKWYGVQCGRNPGVYTDWQDVLDQIRGWKGPKHRGFKTRTEAERFVAEGRLEIPMGSIEQGEPAPKKAKSSKKKAGKDEPSPAPVFIDQDEYEAGLAPLPDDASDEFDDDIILDPITDSVRYKTREERTRYTYQAVRPVSSAPIRIYTDGSSLSNGKANAWGGVGVYFGPADGRNISEPLPGAKQTNQRAELAAMARALEVAPKDRKIVIVSDSKYAIDCVTDWFRNWRNNGWVSTSRKAVENKDLVEKVITLLEQRLALNRHRGGHDAGESQYGSGVVVRDAKMEQRAYWDRGPAGVRFEWVKGHASDEGNSAADELAVAGARAAQQFGVR
jgi:ribonuclease HI